MAAWVNHLIASYKSFSIDGFIHQLYSTSFLFQRSAAMTQAKIQIQKLALTILTTKHLQRTPVIPDMDSPVEIPLACAKLMATGLDYQFSVGVSKPAEGIS
jgi:hypothetical protein